MYIKQNYRIYPTYEQEQLFSQWMGCGRVIWNKMIDLNNNTYKETKKFAFYNDMSKEIIKQKNELPWLSDCPSQVLQQKCMDLSAAISKFIKNKKSVGFPSYKSRRKDTSGIRFPQGYKFNGNRLILPKMKRGVKINLHREILGRTTGCTIIRNNANQWFASFTVEVNDVIPIAFEQSLKVVGVDVGLKDFAVCSDGVVYKSQNFLRKAEGKIKKAQRKLAKKEKGSKNREKARLEVAKLHNKVYNQRTDYIKKTAHSIVKSADVVVTEDLNISGMMKNHCLAKSIADASWYAFTQQLEWQCKKNGKIFHKIGTFFPSSKTCNKCGCIKDNLGLSTRTYICNHCSHTMDRDLNAACNIRDQGKRDLTPECSNTAGTAEINAL